MLLWAVHALKAALFCCFFWYRSKQRIYPIAKEQCVKCKIQSSQNADVPPLITENYSMQSTWYKIWTVRVTRHVFEYIHIRFEAMEAIVKLKERKEISRKVQ